MALDQEKSVFLQKEAQGLIEELTKGGYRQGPKEIKFVPTSKKINEIPRKEVKLEPKPKQKFGWPFLRQKETKLSEGEALYKVAVSDGKITLDEAVEIGLANSVQAKATRKKIEVAKAKLTEAKRALFPTVQTAMVLPNSSGGKQPNTGVGAPAPRTFRSESFKINDS